jgi:ATP-dependent DNA ligase
MPRARRTEPGAWVPSGLTGPVDLELARAVDSIPDPSALPGGSRYEPKWDGYRACIVRTDAEARIWSRQGKDLAAQFPDVARAADQQLDPGVVVDGVI